MRLAVLLLVVFFAAPLSFAQTGTFTFSTSPEKDLDNGVNAVTEIVGGVTLTVTATGQGAASLAAWDYSGWKGMNGYCVADNDPVNSLILTFSNPVNVSSLRFADGSANGSTGTFVFTPNVGTAFTATDNGSGMTVVPAGGFAGITMLTITRQDGTAFYFALDDVTMDASLPVELTGFTAAADGSDAVLRWETASETNNVGFEVQMDAGAGFAPLGFVAGAGTSLEGQRYSYRTAGLAPGTYTFRLRQVDFDGAFAFSPAVELSVAPQGYALLAPSTFADLAEVQLSVERGQHVRASLYDLLGREVQVLHSGAVEGTTRLSLGGAALPSGVYFVRVTGETFTATRQIVRVR